MVSSSLVLFLCSAPAEPVPPSRPARPVAARNASARIIEALDELEDGNARFGLSLEPAPVEKLALERPDTL
jgi:hypothetical protein